MEDFFRHENQACPPSLSNCGKLRLPGSKSDVVDCLAAHSQPQVHAPESIDVIIIDGPAVVNMIKPSNSANTFAEYASLCFIPYIESQLQQREQISCGTSTSQIVLNHQRERRGAAESDDAFKQIMSYQETGKGSFA